MTKMNPVIHFEMPAEDSKRMTDFYTKVFGWQMQVMGDDMGGYVVATTTESDDNGPKEPGRINGGFFPKTKDTGQHPSVVIAVDDLDEHLKKAEAAGAKRMNEPTDIPGIGRYVSFKDTEGNQISMLQPIPRSGQ